MISCTFHNRGAWPKVEHCMQAFEASIHKDVVIHNLQGESSPNGEDLSKVYINFFSAPPGCIPPGEAGRTTVDTLFGVPLVDTQRDTVVYDPPEEDEGMYREICDSNGAAAVHRGNTLWIFNSLSHKEAGGVIFWLGSILTAAMPLILDRKSSPGRWSAAISAVNSAVQKIERSLEDALSALETQKKDLSQKLDYILPEIEEYKKEICDLRGRKFTEKKFEDEINLILKLDGVQKVEVVDAKIYISLDEILVPFEGCQYIIAPLTVSIDIISGAITINGIGYYSGNCHPHVLADGRPCWGDTKLYMCELIKNYEFSILVGMTLAFLRQINENDWCAPVTEWPKKRQKNEKYNCNRSRGETASCSIHKTYLGRSVGAR